MTSWNTFFTQPIIQSELEKISQFRKKSLEEDSNLQIYPESENVFKAFTLTPFESVKVVIIGQDPYHGPGQANGYCFSVKNNIKIKPPKTASGTVSIIING